MWFSWHGSASFSIKIGSKEILVDPSFSEVKDYGPWYMPNRQAPGYDQYIKEYNPDYIIITHGHFDHFDLQTIKKIEKVKKPKYIGSPEVTEALLEYFQIPAERLISIKPAKEIKMNGDFAIKAYQGEHFLTGADGTAAARKFKNRLDRYGVMPCGGPMLGYLLAGKQEKIYISGDTLLSGIPRADVDIAILYLGGDIIHPVTKEKYKSIIDVQDAVTAVETLLKPKYVIPVHYDFQYMEPIDIKDFSHRVQLTAAHPTVVALPYNTWIEIN